MSARRRQAGPQHGAARQRKRLVTPEVPTQGRGMQLLKRPAPAGATLDTWLSFPAEGPGLITLD